mgnify:CR=1 FL=1
MKKGTRMMIDENEKCNKGFDLVLDSRLTALRQQLGEVAWGDLCWLPCHIRYAALLYS